MEDLTQFEKDWRKAELMSGDLIWQFGRTREPDWVFIGIPGTRIGVSYYFVTGIEDSATHARLVELVS